MDGAAPPAVTDHQRAYFDAYGYLRLPGLFADDIDELSEAFDKVFADDANPRLELSIVGHRWEPWTVMGYFVDHHPRLRALVDDERLTAVADELLGAGASFVGSDGNIYTCETEWHYDSAFIPRRHIKFAFYLEPLDERTGTLRVLPASHHDPDVYRGPLEAYLGYDGAIEARTGIRGEDLPHWSVPTDPGDVLVWDFQVMHAAYGSTARRRQLALNYCAPEAASA